MERFIIIIFFYSPDEHFQMHKRNNSEQLQRHFHTTHTWEYDNENRLRVYCQSFVFSLFSNCFLVPGITVDNPVDWSELEIIAH